MSHVHIPDRFFEALPSTVTYSTAPSGCTNIFTETTADTCDFVASMTGHKVGRKEGPARSNFWFEGDVRTTARCKGAGTIFMDSDFGAFENEIIFALLWNGLAGAIATTYSHLTTEKRISEKKYQKWKAGNPDGSAADFMRRLGYHERIAGDARLLEENGRPVRTLAGRTKAGDGIYELTLIHPPCPKYRIILFLDRPWLVADYPSADHAERAWKAAIRKIASDLGFKIDESCFDLARCYFEPRHPPGTTPRVRYVRGKPIDTRKLFSAIDDASTSTASTHCYAPSSARQKVFDGDLDILRSAVMAIKNDERFDDRNEWIKVLGAIHFETDGSPDGLEIALEWSETWEGGSDDPDETERVWNSLRRDG